ncbi:MAG: phosphoglycerate mutase, partial [Chloroflexi bacterium]|nr:phosphoglycerate mutase [Chloroflexota bacterium]
MIDFPYIKDICQSTPSRVLMLVADGLGGAPHPEKGKSELEVARTPNLDRLASRSACGLTTPVLPGITPGSGPGHLSLFGYDPVKYLMGRGVLEALGIDVDMREGDVAARGNFCTLDSQGRLVDRRAGRISSEESTPLCEQLDQIEVPGVEVRIFPVKDYRFVALFRGEGLDEKVTETDPQVLGVPPRRVKALAPGAEKTAAAANALVEGAQEVLGSREKANMVLLRGFSQLPQLPDFGQTYQL